MPEMNMKEFNEKVERWATQFPAAAVRAIGAAAMIVEKEVMDKHLSGPKMPRGVGSKTRGTLQPGSGSELLNSITSGVLKQGSKIIGRVSNDKHRLPYARIHEYGGIIRPKKGKFLKFTIGDRTIFAKQVKIPERSYMRSSLKAKRKTIISILTKAMKRSYTDA